MVPLLFLNSAFRPNSSRVDDALLLYDVFFRCRGPDRPRGRVGVSGLPLASGNLPQMFEHRDLGRVPPQPPFGHELAVARSGAGRARVRAVERAAQMRLSASRLVVSMSLVLSWTLRFVAAHDARGVSSRRYARARHDAR